MTIDQIREAIEKRFRSEYGRKWGKKEILYFLNKTKYKIDNDAINKNLVDPIEDFVLRGGKRVRPLLFLSCIELFGGKADEYLDYAVAIELIHNGTLVLDDIEDNAELRRGKPTIHKKYGLDTATNVGVSMHIMPLTILMNSKPKLSQKQKLRVVKIYTEELTNVSFGQALDIYWHKNHPVKISVDEYLEMVRLKTGSLMRMSMRLACAVMHRTNDTEELFKDFAERLGMGFQIIDDCLDLDPPSDKFGKAYGNDITEGKLSLPVIYTLENAENKDCDRLQFILKKHTRNKKLINEAIDIIKKYDSIMKSRNFASELVKSSWTDLSHKWERRNSLDSIESITSYLVSREY